MLIKRIYKVIPVPIFYVDDLGWAGGRSYGPYIRILKRLKDDRGLLEHELQHCRQFYRTFGLIHKVLYKFSRRYRYFAEIECYKIQLSHNVNKDAAIKRFVEYITTRYNLDVSASKAELDLRRT